MSGGSAAPPAAGAPAGRITDAEALALLERRRPARRRRARRRGPAPLPPRRRGHLHRRPQHQLHRLLPLRLPVLRLLQEAGERGGLPARRGGHPPQDRGDARAGRHRDHDAGRPAPGPRHLLVRGGLQRHQGALSDPHPLALAAGDRAHREAERPERGGDADAAPRRRPRQSARRRRRGARRPRAHRHQPAQDPHGHVAERHARRPRPRHEDHGDHDVRLPRHAGRTRSSTCAASATCRTRPAASPPSSRGPSRPATRSCRPATSRPRASTTS